MKKINFAALLAIAGAGIATQSAQATLSSNPGDLFIGFRNTAAGVTQDYLIDVGSASLFDQMNGTTFTLNVGGTATDLSSIFDSSQTVGKNWYTGNKTSWGVIGNSLAGDATSTIYVGKPENPLGTFPTDLSSSPSYFTDTTSNQGLALTSEGGLTSFYNGSGSATANSSVATFQLASNGSSWASKVNGTAFGRFSGFSATINSGTSAGTALDLFEMVPDNVTPGTQLPTYLGRFVIDSTGAINYTAVTAAPEPSTLTALAGGVGILGFFLRRRRAVVA